MRTSTCLTLASLATLGCGAAGGEGDQARAFDGFTTELLVSNGTVHLVTEGRHARLGSGGWTSHETPALEHTWRLSSAALDQEGRLHTIRFKGGAVDPEGGATTFDTYYMAETRPDGPWDGIVHMGSSSVTLTSTRGVVHRCAPTDSSGEVVHSWLDQGAWLEERLRPGVSVEACWVLADESGSLHAVVRPSGGEALYGSNASGRWAWEVSGCMSSWAILRVRAGVVSLACKGSAGEPAFAERLGEPSCGGAGDCWRRDDEAPRTDSDLGFDLGPEGTPHILTVSGIAANMPRSLRHSYRGTEGWVTETVATETIFFGTSIAVDDEGTVHVAWVRWWPDRPEEEQNELNHAWRAADGAWHTEALP